MALKTLGAISLSFTSALALAAPPELYLGVDSRFSDNVEKASAGEQDDIENRFSLSGLYRTDPGRCEAVIDGEVAYSIYSENTYDPETAINAGATGVCEIVQGLSWEIDNQTREVTRSERRNDTPDNRSRKNVFSTGPTYLWRVTPRDSLRFSTRYENTELSDPEDIDSERVTGSIGWTHLFASDLSAGLSGSVSDAELDTGAEIQTTTLSTNFNKRWATTSVSGSLGVSEIETELRTLRQSSDGFVGNLRIDRALDSKTNVYLTASRELTDRTSDYDIQFEEFSFVLTDATTLEISQIESGLIKTFSNGDNVSVTAYASRSDYLDSIEREDQSGFNAGYNRRISPQLSANFNGRYQYLTFDSDQSDDQVVGIDLGLTYQASRRAELVGKIGRNERTSDIPTQEFEENWVQIGFNYRLR